MMYLIEALPPDGGRASQRDREQATARQLLARLTGSGTVEHDANGAPYLPERPHLHVSISHCRRAVAVAVSECGAVGIDIESRRRVSNSLMERVCTPDELAAIRESEDPEGLFLRYWTRKEAVLKCRRTGIRGFGSMVAASRATDCTVTELETGLDGVVAALAEARGE